MAKYLKRNGESEACCACFLFQDHWKVENRTQTSRSKFSSLVSYKLIVWMTFVLKKQFQNFKISFKIWIPTHTHLYTYIYTIHTFIYIHTQIYTYINICICTCINIWFKGNHLWISIVNIIIRHRKIIVPLNHMVSGIISVQVNTPVPVSLFIVNILHSFNFCTFALKISFKKKKPIKNHINFFSHRNTKIKTC